MHPYGLEVSLYCLLADATKALQPDPEVLQILPRLFQLRYRALRGDASANQVRNEQLNLSAAVLAAYESAGPDKETWVNAGAVMRKEAA